MPNPRKPTAVKQMLGTAQPCRMNPNEPKRNGEIAKPPRDFSALEKKCYRQIVDQCCPGVLAQSDSLAVEMAATLLAEFRSDRAGFPVNKYLRLETLLGKLGMTPSDRAKVNAVKDDAAEDPWAQFDIQ